MSGYQLAVYTFNQFVAPYLSDKIEGFRKAEPGVFKTIENAQGFVARSGYDGEEGPESWGTQVFPDCWSNSNGDGWAPSTLSLWDSIEALMAATYKGPHGKTLPNGKDWHLQADHIPEFVLWWVKKGTTPNWVDAADRFHDLISRGPNPHAFTFKTAFDPYGRPLVPDFKMVKSIAQRNAQNA